MGKALRERYIALLMLEVIEVMAQVMTNRRENRPSKFTKKSDKIRPQSGVMSDTTHHHHMRRPHIQQQRQRQPSNNDPINNGQTTPTETTRFKKTSTRRQANLNVL